MPADFYSPTETDHQSTSGPIISRAVNLGDVFPQGLGGAINGGNKDVLVDGLHPILAIGAQAGAGAGRAYYETGTVLTYSADNTRVILNVAPGHGNKNYVANIASYGPVVFLATYIIGMPVFVDDSDNLGAGVTLSLSPLNVDGDDNPFHGWLQYDQDDYDDSGVGGAGAHTAWPRTASAVALVETLLTVVKGGW